MDQRESLGNVRGANPQSLRRLNDTLSKKWKDNNGWYRTQYKIEDGITILYKEYQ